MTCDPNPSPTEVHGPGADRKGFSVPENGTITTATGFKNRILAACPDMPHRVAQRMAYRINRRMDYYTRFVDLPVEAVYEEGLRILGIHRDETARDAVRAVEVAA